MIDPKSRSLVQQLVVVEEFVHSRAWYQPNSRNVKRSAMKHELEEGKSGSKDQREGNNMIFDRERPMK